MDYLWTPWRYQYVSQGAGNPGCIFCEALKRNNDAETLILFRGQHNFILLNRFPYTTGHSMIAPFAHGGELDKAAPEVLGEMMLLAQRLQRAFAALYRPDGYNLGMNLGRVAGAGVADHLHLHVLPRWGGDTSFMTTVGETRLEPEDLATTYAKLKPHFQK
ncbi:MAG TPA: HIT domain-containing protein [Candidatus Acidoferrales bacterium]|nr:HIT domain-containing protein [Candidatus Acidoferrales bacterium]